MNVYYLQNRHYSYLYHFIFWQLGCLTYLPKDEYIFLYFPMFGDFEKEDIEILNRISFQDHPLRDQYPEKALGELEHIYFNNIKSNKLIYLDILKLLPKNYKIILSYKDLPKNFKIESIRINKSCSEDSISSEEINFLKNILNANNALDATRRIYITRKNSENLTANTIKTRQIINENELFIFLKKLNFEFIHLENLSLKDKINLFNSAEIIISPNSGALSFLLFANSKTQVIELFPLPLEKKFCHIQFKELSEALGLKYYRFRDMTKYDDQFNMEVDVNKLENFINLNIIKNKYEQI